MNDPEFGETLTGSADGNAELNSLEKEINV